MATTNGLSGMLLADLKRLASGLGIKGSSTMKKAQLVDAIKAHQAGASNPPASAPQTSESAAPQVQVTTRTRGGADNQAAQRPEGGERENRAQTANLAGGRQPDAESKPDHSGGDQDRGSQQDGGGAKAKKPRNKGQGKQHAGNQSQKNQDQKNQDQKNQGQNNEGQNNQGQNTQGKGGQGKGGDKQGNAAAKEDKAEDKAKDDKTQDDPNQAGQNAAGDDEETGGRRNRRRRSRDRNRATGGRTEAEPQVYDDDVLVPAAGILDVLENYAFVRTSGYLAGPDDVYLSLSLVRKHGLRTGDAVVGQVRQPREGERREKFNPMVRIDNVNGTDPDAALEREEFDKLTPLHPEDRLRLETDSSNLIGRVIDLVAPLGKGQRGLIVSPHRAGKTTILQQIAQSVTTNNSECHLMVVLVDERPEEVTDFVRSVKGEVIASTFDRTPSDHVMVAELAIERAKRLVELGHDVVILLDGITRLGRAYNLAAPANGRVLAGGVDASALFGPKRFFGAARNIEDGGSLTIIATATVDSGSAMDEVIYDEFVGTDNQELRLSSELASRQIYPAIDPARSATRHEERLLSDEEQAIVAVLRRALMTLEPARAAEVLLDKVRGTSNNIELLRRLQQAPPSNPLGVQ